MLIDDMVANPLETTIGLVGAPGSGKTHCLSTFRPPEWKPGDPPWMYLMACDRKNQGGAEILMKRGRDGLPIGAGIEVGIFTDAITDPPDTVDQKAPPQAFNQFIAQLKLFGKQLKADAFPYRVVAIDSFTGLWDSLTLMICHRRIRRAIQKGKDKTKLELQRVGLEQGDYLEAFNWVNHFFRPFVKMPCIKVVTFHRRFRYRSQRNRFTGAIEEIPDGVTPLIMGKQFPDDLIGSFEYVFYFAEEPERDGSRTVHTVYSRNTPAKVGIGEFPRKCPADWQVWQSHIKAGLGGSHDS